MTRCVHRDSADCYATDQDGRGVTIMRGDEINSRPSTVLVTWEALPELVIDLMARLGARS